MNKKIYFNNKFILLGNEDLQPSQDQSIKFYRDVDIKKLEDIVADFLSTISGNSLAIIDKDADKTFAGLKKMFHYIEAAGGFIEKEGEILFINRHKRWDLPKGKLEKGETIQNAAIRECEEECGIRNLTIARPLSSTFHIYPYKNSFALKQTYWFYMYSDFGGKLTPQLEEDIQEVKWVGRTEIESEILKDTYYTISDIVKEALTIK